ncbi:unnamed protein product [Moneuplotes crassus]|uniref:Uncharacterized protein n=1 Tax=Euplotes crassus TaxID=5936 RepID=A0AAD1XWG5_EUPCR|nr:unnamed protein product [Moneuplotes crassus]
MTSLAGNTLLRVSFMLSTIALVSQFTYLCLTISEFSFLYRFQKNFLASLRAIFFERSVFPVKLDLCSFVYFSLTSLYWVELETCFRF